MSFTELINKTGELIESSFGIFKFLANSPNVIFATIFSALFIWWIWKMAKYDKEAEQTGSMR